MSENLCHSREFGTFRSRGHMRTIRNQIYLLAITLLVITKSSRTNQAILGSTKR